MVTRWMGFAVAAAVIPANALGPSADAFGQAAQKAPAAAAPVARYRVVNAFPHDPQAFTQGLVYLDGFLYEGTGLNGRSSIRKVRLETGEVVQVQRIDP